MSRIRSDLVGVVTVRDASAQLVTLSAGDEVPEGVVVGDHLTEPAEPAEPAGNAVRRRQAKSE